MLEGILRLSLSETALYTLLMTHVTIASVTIFLHRHQAHRALELHPLVSHFFRFWLWLTTGMVTREWVAVHRKHHAKCETEEDPHSPQIKGLAKVLTQGAELYQEEAAREETLRQYGKGSPDDWIERRLYTPHHSKGIFLMLVLNLVLLGPIGLSVWAVQMIWIPVLAAGVINGVGHYWGYRNFHSPDTSTNIVPWGILIGGEELHNNHHAYPGSAKLSARPWEFDIGWFYIRLLERLGLANVKKVAPPPARVRRRGSIDAEAVRAIVANRLQVLARYGKDVMARVHYEEMRGAADRRLKQGLKAIRRPLLREEGLLDAETRERMIQVVSQSEALQTAYRFGQRLQAVWQSSLNQDRTAEVLQQWCKEAEATGIKALEEFARRLGGYRLPA